MEFQISVKYLTKMEGMWNSIKKNSSNSCIGIFFGGHDFFFFIGIEYIKINDKRSYNKRLLKK